MPTLKSLQNKKWEDLLAFHLQTAGLLSKFAREYKFQDGRRWRFDFADPVNLVAIEVQGAVWSRGKSGHNSGTGINADHEKLNTAQANGWRVFQFTSDKIRNLEAIKFVRAFYVHRLGIECREI